MSSSLVLHRGALLVERDELERCATPASTATWHPIPHAQVLSTVEGTLLRSGFSITRSQYGLTPDGARFFGTLDLVANISEGVTLAVAVRNSHDKTFPIGLVAGSRVFCCDNLAMSSEIYVSKRHTRFGEVRFNEGIATALNALHQFREVEGRRIAWMRDTQVSEDQANSLILQAYEKDIVGARLLPDVIKEWREPSHDDFAPRTVWSLLNCFTEVLKDRQRSQPARAAEETIRLQSLLTGGMQFNTAV